MIDPDSYMNDYYEMNQDILFKSPKQKYSNLNFSKLAPDRKLIGLTINIMLNDKLIIKEKIDWDLTDEKKSPEKFSDILIDSLNDVIDEDLVQFNKTSIKNQILDGLLDHIDKINHPARLKLIKKDAEGSTNNQLCLNCNSVVYNQEYCVNCMYVFEKKPEKKIEKVEIITDELRQTERQRILELRQKNVNVEDIAVTYSAEGKEKKICKKCGEINLTTATECKNCKFKFPFITYFDINLNQSYSVHFWDRINKFSTVQQLKNFGDFFKQEDFCSTKYLYNTIKSVLSEEFEQILTEEAFYELMCFVEKTYFAFTNPTLTSEKIFDSAYYTKFNRSKPKTRMLNFNNLVDIKEGWLNDTLPEKNLEEKIVEKYKPLDPMLKKKRGRPKKMEIFKLDSSKFNEVQITLDMRDSLLKSDLIPEEDLHFDFCGKCEDEGKLICCETCSSAYHFECLGYDRFPRGKFKCYYCKIVKIGIDEAITVDKSQIKLIKNLIAYNRKSKWYNKAEEFLDVIKSHHCCVFFKSPVPEDFSEFHAKIKDAKDVLQIEEKLNKKEYSSLKDFIKELANVWTSFKTYYKPTSFFYKLADTMDNFMTHLIKEEGVFDTFEPDENRISRSERMSAREKVEITLEEEQEVSQDQEEKLKDFHKGKKKSKPDPTNEENESNIDILIENDEDDI